MPRLAYVNGRYEPHRDACVHIEDRGYQFADGVYEVIPVIAGRMVDEEPHLDRLGYSLGELRIAWPVCRPVLRFIMRELLQRNGVADGSIYMQVTRGVAPRDHKFPARSKPSLVLTTKQSRPPAPGLAANGVAVVTRPDIRWRRCDIKSVSLLPNILGKQQAVEDGAFEAWLVDDDGFITEGTSTNAWIITPSGLLTTRDRSPEILSGITRRAVLQLVRESGIGFEERRFSVAEAVSAREAFLTSSSSHVLPVTRIDGQPIGDGKPGDLTLRLRDIYLGYATGRAA